MPVGALHLLFQDQLPVFLLFLQASNLMWRRVCGIITDRVGTYSGHLIFWSYSK